MENQKSYEDLKAAKEDEIAAGQAQIESKTHGTKSPRNLDQRLVMTNATKKRLKIMKVPRKKWNRTNRGLVHVF